MMKWQLSDEDNRILFLMKSLKSDYLESTMNGQFYFSYPDTFTSDNSDLGEGQRDRWDSHLSVHSPEEFFIAPIGEDGKSNIEQRIVLSRNKPVHIISETSEHTPMCCFRKVEECDIEQYGSAIRFRLGNVVDRIQSEFKGHDSFILIIQWKEFLRRLEVQTTYFARSIHYGDVDEEYIRFYNETDMLQAEMFQKDEKYRWEKEFRIILPADPEKPKFVNIGSIRDIAICGKLESLRLGYVIAHDEQSIKDAIGEMNKKK